jgi:predicted metalloprotease
LKSALEAADALDAGERSGNLEDRRGMSFGRGVVPLGLGGIILRGILSLLFNRNFFTLLDTNSAPTSVDRPDPARDAREEPTVQFVSFVLDDSQNTWRQVFDHAGRQYRDAKLVLFRDVVDSGCGMAESATGPFYCPVYCPGDQKIYLDLGFYDELKQRFFASGEFAQAYVLAHEIGHHVQNLLGTDQQVGRALQSRPGLRNALSVRVELQADCLAGVWGHSTQQRNLLEGGDVEAAMNAAAAIGDDRIQRMSRGTVSPDSFTHGSSTQRVAWFKKGMEQGTVSGCNTFQ